MHLKFNLSKFDAKLFVIWLSVEVVGLSRAKTELRNMKDFSR
jgi:hypothetical protein